MNAKEFSDWYADWCLVFPDTAAFVNGAGNPEATLHHWREALEGVSLVNAMEATKLILSGKEPEIPSFRESTIPARIAEIAKRLAARDKAPQPYEAEASPGRREKGSWSCNTVLAELLACAKAGGDTEALAAKLMPIDASKEPRFKCLVCRDRGLVRCWNTHSMRLAERGELTRLDCGSVGIRCECEAGNHYEGLSVGGYDKQGKPRRETPLIYNDRQWCRCFGYSADDIAALVTFMEHYRPANHVAEFDEWNASA